MSDLPQKLTRNQLAEFLPNQRAIRAFELLLKQVGVQTPIDLTELQNTVDQVTQSVGISDAKANQALSLLQKLVDAVESLSKMPVAQPTVVLNEDRQPRALLKLADLPDVLIASAIPGATLVYNPTLRRWQATFVPLLTTQVATPSATGFSVSITSVISSVVYNIWLLLKPTAGFAAGTIVLPAVASCVDQQEVTVSCTQQVNALTVNGNGATVSGAPSSLAADSTFKLRFNLAASTWYRAQ